MSTLRISNIEAKADSSSPTVDEQLRFTNSDGDLMLYLDGRTAGITTVGINTTNQTIKFDANNNVMITGIVTATEFHGSLAVGTSVTYGDNEKAYFGTGLDLELFHNGTNSVINNTEGALLFQNNGSSSMYIGSNGQVYLNNDITFVGASANALWDKSENYFSIPDKIVHSGDTNTAIRFPANDTFTVETGGSERFRVDSNGRVTIGIGASANSNVFLTIPRLQSTGDAIRLISQRNDTAPADLSFVKSRSTTYGSFTGAQDDDFVMAINSYIDTGSALSYRGTYRSIFDTSTGGVHYQWGSGTSPSTTGEKMRLTATGNLGIGTALPLQRLHVKQGSTTTPAMVEALGAKSHVKFQHNAGNSYTTTIGSKTLGAGNVGLTFDTGTSGGGTKMTIDVNGRIGIGTELPQTMHHLFGSSGLYTRFESAQGQVNFGNSNGAGVIHVTSTTEPLRILVNGNNERLRIFSNGSVGVGDYSSTNLTHAFQALRTSGSTYLSSKNTGGNAIFYAEASSGNTAKLELMQAGVGNFTLEVGSDNALMFKDDGTEKLRIDSTGRLIMGHDAALTKFHGPYSTNKRNPQIQINGTTVNNASLSITSWDNNVVSYYGPAIFLAKSGSSTIGTNSRVSNQNSILGSIIFSGDDGDEFVKGAMIQAAVDNIDGAQTGNNDMPGRLQFLTTQDGAQEPTERLRILSNGRIKFIEDPIQRNSGSVDSFSGDGAYMQHYVSRNGSTYRRNLDIAAVGDGSWGCSIRFSTNPDSSSTSLERMRIDHRGIVTKPYHPSFCARHNNGDGFSGDIIVLTRMGNPSWDVWNTGGHYSTSTGKFTAPVTGVYYFEGQLMTTGHSNGDNIQDMLQLYSNRGRISYCRQRKSYFRSDEDANGYYTNSVGGSARLDAGDTVWLQRQSGHSWSYSNRYYSYFTGWLIG